MCQYLWERYVAGCNYGGRYLTSGGLRSRWYKTLKIIGRPLQKNIWYVILKWIVAGGLAMPPIKTVITWLHAKRGCLKFIKGVGYTTLKNINRTICNIKCQCACGPITVFRTLNEHITLLSQLSRMVYGAGLALVRVKRLVVQIRFVTHF